MSVYKGIRKSLFFAGLMILSCIIQVNMAHAGAGRELNDSIPAGTSDVINISARKADITIHSWDKPMVRVYVRIAVSHSDETTAKRELQYVHCNTGKTGKNIYINNYFSLPAGVNRINSVISVNYEIYVPAKTSLIINNDYGNCEVNGVNGLINLNNNYGNIYLNNLQGIIRIYAKLCNIKADLLYGESEFNTENSDYSVKNLNGNVTISNKVGKLLIEPGDRLRFLKINSSNSEVELKVRNFDNFNYVLNTKNAEVKIADKFNHYPFKRKSDSEVYYTSGSNKPAIEIYTSFNNIKIN